MFDLDTENALLHQSVSWNDEERRSRNTYHFCIVILIVLPLFALRNLYIENYASAAIIFFSTFPIIIAAIASKKPPVSNWTRALIAIPLLCLLTLIVLRSDNSEASIMWFFIVPILMVSAFGALYGILFSFAWLLFTSGLFYLNQDLYSNSHLVRFYEIYALITFVCYIQEKSNAIARSKINDLIQRNSDLELLLPICAWCKQIRDDDGSWQNLESYVTENSNTAFSHGICNHCADKQKSEFQNI